MEYAYGKKIFLHGFISIYLLLIIRGLIVLFFVLLFSLILFLADKNNETFSKMGIFFTSVKYIFLMIANIFANFFSTLFLWLLIDRFSPNYFPLGLILY